MTDPELFGLLAAGGWLAEELAERLGAMAGFRNVLVHGYADVDLEVVRDVLEGYLPALVAFVAVVRARL